jgi:hypothetical protein
VLDDTPEGIERSLRYFGDAYAEQNPRVFRNANDATVFAFALVMLNTELKRPSIDDRMSCEEFVSILMNAFGQSRLPKDHLVKAFVDVRDNSFGFTPKSVELMAQCSPRKFGWLKKKSIHLGGQWVMHLFVLRNGTLCYFADTKPENHAHPLGKVQLIEVDTKEDPYSDRRFCVISRGDQIQYLKLRDSEPVLVRGVKTVLFEARSGELAADWLFRIRKAAVMSYFLRGVVAPTRKKEEEE